LYTRKFKVLFSIEDLLTKTTTLVR